NLSSTPPIYTLSLHDALPISLSTFHFPLSTLNSQLSTFNSQLSTFNFPLLCNKSSCKRKSTIRILQSSKIFNFKLSIFNYIWVRSEEHTSELQSRENLVCRLL